MRVFLTGASGHIGSAVVPQLLQGGHRVVGLARSDASVAALEASGVEVERGALEDLDTLRQAAEAAGGVIHLAYMHDAPPGVDAAAADVKAIEAIGDGLEGSGKPFVGASGTLVLAPGRVGTETDPPDPEAPARARIPAENTALALVDRGIRSSVVRLAPSVHGSLDLHGFIPALIGIARDKGVAAFVGDGANRWPAVHTLDAARLFRLALEAGSAGSRWHGVGDEGVPFWDIADVFARRLGLPATSITAGQAEDHFGWLSFATAADNPTSSSSTRRQLGWRPEHPGLIADLEDGHYFNPR